MISVFPFFDSALWTDHINLQQMDDRVNPILMHIKKINGGGMAAYISIEHIPGRRQRMYYDRYLPFYMAHSAPLFYEGESQQEKEFQLIKSYYPKTALRVQEKVEEVCDQMDYPGSPIYDEYPDRFTLDHICRRIAGEMETGDLAVSSLEELVQVLLFQEIHRRRCRSCGRRYF